MIAELNVSLPRLLPVSLEPTIGETFRRQLDELVRLSDGLVEWLPAAYLGDRIGAEVSAVVIPDLSGLAYRLLEAFRVIDLSLIHI